MNLTDEVVLSQSSKSPLVYRHVVKLMARGGKKELRFVRNRVEMTEASRELLELSANDQEILIAYMRRKQSEIGIHRCALPRNCPFRARI